MVEAIRTLREAHEYLGARRPVDSTPVQERVEFFRQSARIYAAVAETDRFHHHEALYWAAREREHGDAAQRELAKAKGVVRVAADA